MAGNTLNRVMDRRKKLVRNAPTMKVINQSAFKIAGYKHHLSYGIWMFSALTFVLLFLKAPASNWVPMLAVALLLGGVYWRWTFLSNQVGDARISDYVLSDAVDLAWLEWARDLEPQVDALLEKRRPDRRYTARDFQHAYRCHAYYWADLPKRAPYYGDSDRCFDDLEKRREPQRRARAERNQADERV